MYDYFYGQQAELFSFYRVPKVLFTDEKFSNISSDAEYRQVRKDMQEYLTAKQTVEHILGIDRKKREEKEKQREEENRQ